MSIRDFLSKLGLAKKRPQRADRGVRYHRPIRQRRRDEGTEALGRRHETPPDFSAARATAPPAPPPAAAATEVQRSRDPWPAQPVEPGTVPAAPQGAPVSAARAPTAEAEATRYVDAPSVSGGIVAVLAAVDGPLSGQVFGIGEGETLIGRDKQCRVVTESEWISRRHTKIVHAEGQFVIGPLSERNPTFLNDHPTEGSELKDGDFIRLGRTTFRFRTL